jgi:FkbM family methyltransferase
MHRGQDTDFYLKKGYRVVGFEADPTNAAICRKRFSDAISTGRLTIIEGAITEDHELGSVRFYRNENHSLWGSTSEDWAVRNEVMGTTNEIITVRAVDFAAVVAEHGVPHYLKADIVGSETICLRSLLKFAERPDYISIRSEKLVFRKLEREFDLLEELGYNAFKAVKQEFDHIQPIIGNNGTSERYRFEEGASGPFGEESPGRWRTREQAIADYRRIFVAYWLFGDYSYLIQTERGRRFLSRLERLTRRTIPGWYDTHARHGGVRQ